ncbi:hypothetical protein M8J76_001883 [Diaphorina citri]|nr:hypothetical protein M8J75_002989 [Diaphorina citri]KAI5732578.1 hypothetical protein M8J76_001883 [Diaphorina citri]
MEMSLAPVKKRVRKRNSKKPKLKKEFDDSSYDGFSGSALQRAVDTIMYEDNDGDDVSPSISQNHKSKVFVEPDTDHIVFTKVSIPKTMRSIYWKYFGFPANDNGDILTKKKTICTLCSSQFSYNRNTSNLRSHLARKHKLHYEHLDDGGPQVDMSLNNSKKKKNMMPHKMLKVIDLPNPTNIPQQRTVDMGGGYSICVQGENEGEHAFISIPQTESTQHKKKAKPASGKSLMDLIVDFVILDLQPPSIVNSEGFRHLVSNLSPVCEIPLEQTIIQDFVPKLYDTLKNSMYNDITAINLTNNMFSLALEHWESNDREYISYYINYLLEEKFTTKLLHTFLLDKETTHDTFYHQEMFTIICSSWNIKTSNIKAVILASDNQALHQVVVNQDIPVIPCLIRTLSQMCIKAFEMTQIQSVITKCRSIISQIYNKNNFAIQVTFADQNQPDDATSTFLSLDNPNVWLSTLNMLEALNAARSKLSVLLELSVEMQGDTSSHISDDEWYILEKVLEVFNPIKVTVVTLSEEKPAQASLILPLYLQLVNHHLKTYPGDDTITTQLKTYFVEYLTQKYSSVDSFLQVCTALDPRVKRLPYIEEQDVFGTIKDILVNMEPPSSEGTKYYTDVVEQENKKSRLSGMEFLLGNVSSTKSSTKPSPSNHADNIAHEVEQYHRSSPVPLNECPLTWWKSECNRFPNLYLLAVKYNCVPACTTPCGKTMEMKAQCTYVEKRKLLSQNTQAVLNHLLFLHHNYTV